MIPTLRFQIVVETGGRRWRAAPDSGICGRTVTEHHRRGADGTTPGAAAGDHVYKVSSRVRKDSTARTHASRASIMVQCPQLGNTCSSALGMSRIGKIAESTGLTRSSRPQVIRVGA